jgi:hypothetical protein
VTVSGTGTASTSVTGLTQTGHTLSATYSGDVNWAAAGPISVSITVTAVKIGTFASLKPEAQPAAACSAGSFQVSVTSASGPAPGGEVQLRDGSTVIASQQLANGTATLKSVPLRAGSHSMTAVYLGDATHSPSTSQTLLEKVVANSRCSPIVIGTVGLDGGITE